MAATFTSLYFWLFAWLAVISLARAQAPDFIYNGFKGANLQLDEIARIHSNGLLQLTNSSTLVSGHAFYPSPVHFNTSSVSSARSLSFSTNFVIAMVPKEKGSGGHGIAFVISPSMDFSQADPVQYLGVFNASNNGNNSNHIFAVEFDTVRSIELDMNEIDNNHVGIDVNGVSSIQSAPVAYFSNEQGKNINLELISGQPIQVWIDYDDGENIVNATLAPIGTPKPDRPLLSTSIDLSIVLLDTMYVGFSASTGSTIASNQYILGWSFNRSGLAQSLDISELPGLPKVREKLKTYQLILIITAVLLAVIVIAAAYVYHRKKFEEVTEDWEMEYGPQRYSYKTLFNATQGFKDKQLLGSGGFGKVYKGTIPSSDEEIAVKKVISHDKNQESSNQGMKEFVSEIVSMGRLRHRNLVRLLGYCRRRKELLLVYECMPNGSLDKFLFGNDHPTLTWPQRFHIIRGVTSALVYLHEGWEKVVLHRDIKASNVLLDSNLNGHLGDFGLARLYDHDGDPQTTRLVGTLGYLDPELARTGKATKSSDVFAFGVFLLEVACGRKPIDTKRPPEEVFLVEMVSKCWKMGAILDACDPRLQGNYAAEEMEKVLRLGLLCSNSNPDLRPTIKEVEQYLDGNASLPDIPLDNISAQNLPLSSPRLETSPLLRSGTETSISSANQFTSSSVTSFTSSAL